MAQFKIATTQKINIIIYLPIRYYLQGKLVFINEDMITFLRKSVFKIWVWKLLVIKYLVFFNYLFFYNSFIQVDAVLSSGIDKIKRNYKKYRMILVILYDISTINKNQ